MILSNKRNEPPVAVTDPPANGSTDGSTGASQNPPTPKTPVAPPNPAHDPANTKTTGPTTPTGSNSVIKTRRAAAEKHGRNESDAKTRPDEKPRLEFGHAEPEQEPQAADLAADARRDAQAAETAGRRSRQSRGLNRTLTEVRQKLAERNQDDANRMIAEAKLNEYRHITLRIATISSISHTLARRQPTRALPLSPESICYRHISSGDIRLNFLIITEAPPKEYLTDFGDGNGPPKNAHLQRIDKGVIPGYDRIAILYHPDPTKKAQDCIDGTHVWIHNERGFLTQVYLEEDRDKFKLVRGPRRPDIEAHNELNTAERHRRRHKGGTFLPIPPDSDDEQDNV